MFGLFSSAPRPTWKRVEDDFVMGACSRRIFGFASRGDGQTWTAFDDQSQTLGSFDRLADAQEAMWEKHQALHPRVCEPAHARFPKRLARPYIAVWPLRERPVQSAAVGGASAGTSWKVIDSPGVSGVYSP